MARKPSGNPTGRPEKPINWDQFEQLCGLQCIQDEIADMFGIHSETLSNRVRKNYGEDYSIIYKRFANSGKCSLRRNQFVLSKKNASVAIWLGKVWLGQKEPAVEMTATPEMMYQFAAVMKQLNEAQSALRMEETKIIK